MTTASTTGTADRVLALLPEHVRRRDAETGRLLADVLAAVADLLADVESDVDDLYASWFIETCPEWVVPYIADLIGVADLPPDLHDAGAPVSRRALVANTVGYRQRKGTVAVLEDVARAASGWPARAVEYYRHLAVTTHVNHVRLDRPATASLRTRPSEGGPLELVGTALDQGALDRTAHTGDVRHIARHRGRHNIRNVGVYLFPDLVNDFPGQGSSAPHVPARPGPTPADGWWLHPLALDAPLYAVPATETTVEHLAVEANLSVPLRPRRLLALLLAARSGQLPAAQLPVSVWVDGAPVPPDRLRVCGLEDLADNGAEPPVPLSGWQVMVDTVRGRLHPYLDGVATDPTTLTAGFAYGTTADVGAGSHDRSLVHQRALDADPFASTDDESRDRGRTLGRSPAAGGTWAAPATTLTAAVAAATTAWSSAPAAGPRSYVVALTDSGVHAGGVAVHVPASSRLVIVAATPGVLVLNGVEVEAPPAAYDPAGVRPTIAGDLTITGESGSSVVLDGVVVDGDVVVASSALGSLTISQCTVAGAVRVLEDLTSTGLDEVMVRVVSSVVGSLHVGPVAVTVDVRDSVVDGETWSSSSSTGAAGAVTGDHVDLHLDGVSVRGPIAVRTLSATSSILDGHAVVEDTQVGCVRYSYVPIGSRVPRRFRCVPLDEDPAPVRPSYTATDVGSPHYLALSRTCAPAIAGGGEGESEMGVHHVVQRPARLRAARRLLAPYVPVGLEIGVAAPVAAGRS